MNAAAVLARARIAAKDFMVACIDDLLPLVKHNSDPEEESSYVRRVPELLHES